MNNIVKNNIFLIGSFIFCFSLICTLSTAFAMDSDDMWKQIKSKVLEAPKDNNSDNQEEKEKAVGELLRKNILKPGEFFFFYPKPDTQIEGVKVTTNEGIIKQSEYRSPLKGIGLPGSGR